MEKYRYSKRAGALQDAYDEPNEQAIPPPSYAQSQSSISQRRSNVVDLAVISSEHIIPPGMMVGNIAQGTAQAASTDHRLRRNMVARSPAAPQGADNGLDTMSKQHGAHSMFFYTIEDGQRALLVSKGGEMSVVKGPTRVWRWGKRLRPMAHYVAHPGDFLIVRYRDGRQEHIAGPAHVWFDPREHMAITKEEALPISAKEAVVVYSEDDESGEVNRSIVYGPATFVPKPGQWLHTFSWHGAAPGGEGYRKVPNALIFQKLWLMPDQMYHDVTDVRTSDDALLTIRLMMFFELRDIERMLITTHDPIGDFINAATADIIEFVSRHSFESLKSHTEKLNDIDTYKQLSVRAAQCGYSIDKVVYRGYGAPQSLQHMHDQAIESRTRLQLQRATEEQAQELEDFKQERSIGRDGRVREDARERLEHDLLIEQRRRQADLEAERERREFARSQAQADLEQAHAEQQAKLELERVHLEELARMGVELTPYMTQGRADQVIEVRGSSSEHAPHIHLKG